MRFINTTVAVVGTAVAFAAPLHHSAFRLVHGEHARRGAHPDSVVAESITGARCVVHLGGGRAALIGLTDDDHLAELHAWLTAIGRPDSSITAVAVIALPGALPDSAKARIRSGFHDHAGVRVLLDWGGGAVHHGGQRLPLPMIVVVGATATRMTAKSGVPDSASIGAIHDALSMAVGEARRAALGSRVSATSGSPLPVVRCEAPSHST